MLNNHSQAGPPRGSLFTVSAVATVLISVALLGMGIHWLRPAPPPAPPPATPLEPIVRYVEKRVEVPVKVPVATPVLPPLPIPPRSAQQPLPQAAAVAAQLQTAAPGGWNGVWKRPDHPLPLFEVKQTGNGFVGKVAPNWTGVYFFNDGKLKDEGLEFTATDPLQVRVHFRLELMTNGEMRAVQWLTAEDVLVVFNNAIRLARTPQQAAVLRRVMQQMIKKAGQVEPLGTFRRIADPGE